METLSNSSFEQTVLATPEQLQILPENILSVLANYQHGKLKSITKESVTDLLQAWFDGTLTKENVVTSQCCYTPCDIDAGFESCTGQKRQRFDRDV